MLSIIRDDDPSLTMSEILPDTILKVLIAEDDEVDQKRIQRLLKDSKYKIDLNIAASFSEGLEQLNNYNFECVLVDYVIPGRNGIELIQEARRSGIKTPMIVVSGYGDKNWGNALISAGAFDYSPKDLMTSMLLIEKISKAVAHNQNLSLPRFA